MKHLFLTLALGCLCSLAHAQTDKVSSFEGGLYVGLSSPVGNFHDGTPKAGALLGADMRYNVNGGPIDCGLFLEISSANRDFRKDGSDTYQNNRTMALGIASHYNFRQGTSVNPYAGLGLGFALNDVIGDRQYPSKHYSLAVSPRIGVELLRHIRVGCQAQLSREGFHNIALTLGFAIGGRKKK